jgi:hypothetical protein
MLGDDLTAGKECFREKEGKRVGFGRSRLPGCVLEAFD